MEELRAELTSAFLAAALGIPSEISNHASYIQNWPKPLNDVKRETFRAAATAQKIVDLILGLHPDYAPPSAEPLPPTPIPPLPPFAAPGL
jgi:antirestriction protein ArdC